ncbi:LysR family transcriptional regulator [Roseibium salinum]|nr:LysR family transcriptional regulator [Roseibium salinum]
MAELGSLSAAGREFGLSPSAASSRLSNLEKELGTQLVARTTRRTGLTEAGQVFLNHAAAAVGELEQAKALIDAAEDTPRGLLRISSNVFLDASISCPIWRNTGSSIRMCVWRSI